MKGKGGKRREGARGIEKGVKKEDYEREREWTDRMKREWERKGGEGN